MATIFLVEDNDSLREAVSSYLRLNDHSVHEFSRLGGVIDALQTKDPDLLILDVMLPDGDGFHLARKIRKTHSVPIIFLTAKSSESDRITGFELGGDDYVVKPFSTKELVLRAEAVLKRGGTADHDTNSLRLTLEDENLVLDESTRRAMINGKELMLTAAEWKILSHLGSQPGFVIPRERLMGEALDYLVAEGSERTIDTHIKNLRAKLGNHRWIETVRGFGYRFSGEKQ